MLLVYIVARLYAIDKRGTGCGKRFTIKIFGKINKNRCHALVTPTNILLQNSNSRLAASVVNIVGDSTGKKTMCLFNFSLFGLSLLNK